MAKLSNPCPAQCSGGQGKQHPIDEKSLVAAGISDEWIKRAKRCGYCDEIYSTEWPDRHQRRGRFAGNTLMTAENWKPYDA